MKVSLAALLGAALVDPAAAWGCLGHMITAAIAYDSITANTKAAVVSNVARAPFFFLILFFNSVGV